MGKYSLSEVNSEAIGPEATSEIQPENREAIGPEATSQIQPENRAAVKDLGEKRRSVFSMDKGVMKEST
jgi:hypothetical protein